MAGSEAPSASFDLQQTSPARGNEPRVLGLHPLKFLARRCNTGDPAATIDRLFASQHVADLRWIVGAALVALVSISLIGLVFSIENQIIAQWQSESGKVHQTYWWMVRIGLGALGSLLTFLGPALAGFAAVCAWAYQAGSARLGVVDLFACEIGTLCRVSTVLDSVHRLIERFEQGPPVASTGCGTTAPTRPFLSEEDYFTVFNSNSKDLQSLEARVVINITAFYTYMKAVRDSMRVLATVPAQDTDLGLTGDHGTLGPWHQTARDVIYLWFLGLESARLAITDLVEFEPEQAERVIVVLISELEAYQFLCDQFSDRRDIRYGRIRLRATGYHELVPRLYGLVESKRAEEQRSSRAPVEWLPAAILLPELRRRYTVASEASSAPDAGILAAETAADTSLSANRHPKTSAIPVS